MLPAPRCPGWEGAGFLALTSPGTRWGKELNPAFYCPDAIALQSAVQGHRLGGEKSLCSAFGSRDPGACLQAQGLLAAEAGGLAWGSASPHEPWQQLTVARWGN